MRYYIYIVTNKSNTLYVGMTNNIERRIWEHSNKLVKGFTEKYNIDRLIYYEEYSNVEDAIAREKQLKNWNKTKESHINKDHESNVSRITVTHIRGRSLDYARDDKHRE